MKAITLLFAVLLAAAQPVHAETIQVEHAQGTAVFDTRPERTVVFDLATLDNLQALDVEVAGVPDARFPAHLVAYADPGIARVGTLFEPDLDAVRALKPDVILIAGRSSRAYAQLNAIAPTIDLSASTGDFFRDATANLETLGRLYGKQAEAAERTAELRARRDAVAALASGKTGLVLFTINGNVMPHPPGARFGILHDALGLAAVLPSQAPARAAARPEAGSPEAAAARAEQQRMLASALQAEPDWLLVLDRGLATGGDNATATDLSSHPGITASQAWQAGRVYKLDPPGWYLAGGGYRLLLDTFDAFAALLEQQ